jgi:hypothetical protein
MIRRNFLTGLISAVGGFSIFSNNIDAKPLKMVTLKSIPEAIITISVDKNKICTYDVKLSDDGEQLRKLSDDTFTPIKFSHIKLGIKDVDTSGLQVILNLLQHYRISEINIEMT